METKILKILHELGFRPELVDKGLGYRIEYDGTSMIFSMEEESPNTIFFSVPSVFDVTEENRADVLEVMAKLTGKLMFVQPEMLNKKVWLNYQHFLGDQEPTSEMVEHMIKVLSISTEEFYKLLNSEEDDK